MQLFRLIFLIVLCLITHLALANNQSVWINTFAKELNHVSEHYAIPGIAAAIVDRNGIVKEITVGVIDKPDFKKVNQHTLFSIQSQSKMFTALGVLLAVQQGQLSLNTPVSHYLPWFHPKTRYLSNPEKRMTLRLLLSHRSGLAHEAPIGNNYNPYSPSFMAHVKSINQSWLRFPVNEQSSYSDLGIALAGAILSTVFKQPFTDYMKQHMLDQLNMQDSTFDYEQMINNPNHAVGHVDGIDKLPSKTPLIASGGMYASIIDMTKFLLFQLRQGKVNGKTLLEQHYFDEQQKIVNKDLIQYTGYGLGILVTDYKSDKILAHAGGGFGFDSISVWSVKSGVGITILTNKQSNTISNAIRDIAVDTIQAYIKSHDEHALDPLYINKQGKNIDFSLSQYNTFLGSYVMDYTAFYLIRCGKILCIKKQNKLCQLDFLGHDKFINQCNQHKLWLTKNSYYHSIRDLSDGKSWNLNKPFKQPKGQLKAKYAKWVGTYFIPNEINSKQRYYVTIKDGYLYFDNFQLKQYKDNIFFSADGKALEKQNNRFYWNNMLIKKASIKN